MQQLSLEDPLLGGLDDLRSLGEAVQFFGRLPEHSVGLGEPREQHWRIGNGSGGTQFRQPLREQRKAFLRLPERDQRPSAECQCPSPNNSGKPCSVDRARSSSMCIHRASR